MCLEVCRWTAADLSCKQERFFKKYLDKCRFSLYNVKAVWETGTKNAAIAQPVERILGKDEVASSNLASSSKEWIPSIWMGFILFLNQIWKEKCHSPVDCRLPPAGWRQHNTMCAAHQQQIWPAAPNPWNSLRFRGFSYFFRKVMTSSFTSKFWLGMRS